MFSPSPSEIPGRHTIFSAFSPLGNIFEMKYVATGGNHNWRRKHEGGVPQTRFYFLPGTLTVILGTDFKIHGWDVITTVRDSRSFPKH